jgi:hypothetical protein
VTQLQSARKAGRARKKKEEKQKEEKNKLNPQQNHSLVLSFELKGG